MGRNAYCVGSCWAHDCPFYHGLITYGVPETKHSLLYCFGHAFLPIQTEGAPCYLRPLLHSTERDDLATAPDKEAREKRGEQ